MISSLLIALFAVAPVRTLPQFLAVRDYRPAVEAYSARVRRNPRDAAALRDLARVYDHWHRYDSSLYWWDRAVEVLPESDSSRVGRWMALYRLNEKDSAALAVARETIRQEALAALGNPDSAGLEAFALASRGLSLALAPEAEPVGDRLIGLFPNSPRAYELIVNTFYDSLYPIWTNDTLKVPMLHRFLKRWPETEWRATIWQYLLSSLYTLKDTAAVLAAVDSMTADGPDDPLRWRYAAAILNRMKLAPELAARCARRAIELEPGWQKPPNLPPGQWELDQPTLYGSARLALAEALVRLDSLAAARRWIVEAIQNSRFGPDLEATLGPQYCLLGEIELGLGDTASAELALVKALIAGDSRNQWSPRAESSLRAIRPGEDPVEFGRDLLDYPGPRFTDVTGDFGLGEVKAGRVAWGDFDNDGYQDLLLSGSRLFRNRSGVGFDEVTDSVGLGDANGRGGVWADFDNDGWLDFYSCGGDSVDRVWRNDSGTFRDVTDATGRPSEPGPTEGAAWADFDDDGRVDIYTANYENWAEHSYWPDRLWRNTPGGFADVTAPAGIRAPYGDDRAGRGVAWADFDDDSDQDCFVANYRLQENFLWLNRGDGTFENAAPRLGVAGDEVDGWFGHTIGAAWADFDNDGDLDLFTADLAHPRYIEFSNRSRLYENLGPGVEPRFRDIRARAGIRYEETHSNPAWADVDNDGDLDLYITSIYEGRRSFLYENLGRPFPDSCVLFRETTWLSGTRADNGWGCAFADIDNDGDEDLVVGSGSGVRLYRNDLRPGNHWLEVKVVGHRANRAGIGCRVTVRRGDEAWIREVSGGSGTTSQDALVQHFGLGPSGAPVDVEVRFGDGRSRRYERVAPDWLVVVEETD